MPFPRRPVVPFSPVALSCAFVFVHDVVTDFPDMRAQKKNRCESQEPVIENAVQRV